MQAAAHGTHRLCCACGRHTNSSSSSKSTYYNSSSSRRAATTTADACDCPKGQGAVCMSCSELQLARTHQPSMQANWSSSWTDSKPQAVLHSAA